MLGKIPFLFQDKIFYFRCFLLLLRVDCIFNCEDE